MHGHMTRQGRGEGTPGPIGFDNAARVSDSGRRGIHSTGQRRPRPAGRPLRGRCGAPSRRLLSLPGGRRRGPAVRAAAVHLSGAARGGRRAEGAPVARHLGWIRGCFDGGGDATAAVQCLDGSRRMAKQLQPTANNRQPGRASGPIFCASLVFATCQRVVLCAGPDCGCGAGRAPGPGAA